MQLQSLNTLFTGQNLIELKEISSSNDYALALLQNSSPVEGTAILAYKQTKGRGQRENTWHSEAGKNLTISYIFYPRFIQASRQFDLNLCISLAVCDLVSGYVKEPVFIKWPNDIYIGARKTAGILIENGISGNALSYSVTGIGINVNQTVFEHMPDATSLRLHTGNDLDITECYINLCRNIEIRYLQLKSNKINILRDDYHQRLFRMNVLSDYIFRESRIRARITGVSETGRLLLTGEDEEQYEADLKEIRFLL